MSTDTITVAVTYDRADMARRGRIGAAVLHSRYDSRELTEPARAALWAKWEQEVDPESKLDPTERRRRATYARQAHLLRAARASAIARQKKNAPASGELAGGKEELRDDPTTPAA